jgi:type III secretory pathway component EscS
MEPTPPSVMIDLFWLVFYGSAPALVVASLAGLAVAVLQGVMQINDQSLPQVVKTIVTMVTLIVFAGMSFGPLARAMQTYLEVIPAIGR